MVRFKNRYIVAEVKIQGHPYGQGPFFKASSLHYSITQKVAELHGDFGVAAVKSGFMVKYCNKWTRIVVIRVRHGPHKLLTSCLPFITHVNKHLVSLHTLYIGATLCCCYKTVRLYQKSLLEKMWLTLKTDKEREEMEAAILFMEPLENFYKKTEVRALQKSEKKEEV